MILLLNRWGVIIRECEFFAPGGWVLRLTETDVCCLLVTTPFSIGHKGYTSLDLLGESEYLGGSQCGGLSVALDRES